MRATLAIAALVGSAIAAPAYGYGYDAEVKNVHVVVETVVQTVYVTEGDAAPTPAPQPVYDAPAQPTTIVYEEPAAPSSKYEEPAKPTPTPEVYKPTPTPEEYKPKPTPTPAPETPKNSGYMATVDEWRQKMGMKALVWDSKLESNAKDVVAAGHGQMAHKLNPGTFGQVLAPEKDTDEGFLRAFVGGWLCERPNLPGLNGVCDKMSSGWSYNGQTGHADILTSDSYSKIACANSEGIWCCDLA